MVDLRKAGWPWTLALAVFFVIAIPSSVQGDIYDLGYSVTTQDIKADNTGTVHIVWTNGKTLYYGRIVDNAITGTVQVATGVSTLFWRPYVSVRPDGGSVHAAWCQGGGNGNVLMHSWRNSAGVWRNEPVYQAPSTQQLSMPTCAVDGAGQVHILFGVYNNVATNNWFTLFYIKKSASGAWGNVQSFAPKIPEHTFPMLFTDSTGDVHATWCIVGNLGEDKNDAYYCTAPSGGKLDYDSKIKIPKGPGVNLNGYGEVYVDHKGVVHRALGAWSSALKKLCIDHTRKLPGKSFSAPTRASIDFLNLSSCDPVPAVVAAEDGTAIVAWGQVGADGSNKVKASFYDPDKGTWTLTTVDPAAGIPARENAYRVAMARTAKQLFGVWRGSNGRLMLIVQPLDGTLPEDPPPPPEPPEEGDPLAIFTATPISGPSPLTVTFDGSASYDSDGTILSYDWSFGDGGAAAGAFVSHTYTANGNFTAALTVTDNDGRAGRATEVILVSKPSQPPVADFTFTPNTGIYPCEIVFDATPSRDPDGKIVRYSWNFGDGGRDSGRVVRHTYTRWGTFSISLTVRDDSGAAANKIRNIEISRLYQPLNIRWETHKDESLFQTRYVNDVIWERNPANDALGVQIVLHRVWRKRNGESDLLYRPIGEVTGDVFSYVDKNTDPGETYVYTVTTCDSRGRESPIVSGAGNLNLFPSNKNDKAVFTRTKL